MIEAHGGVIHTNAEVQRIVVRSAPVHKIGSFRGEEVDLSGFSNLLCSCVAVVDKLAERGDHARMRGLAEAESGALATRADDPTRGPGDERLGLAALVLFWFNVPWLAQPMRELAFDYTAITYWIGQSPAAASPAGPPPTIRRS